MSAFPSRRRSDLAVACLLFSVVILATVTSTVAGDITYNIVNYPTLENGCNVSGYITTDGKIGTLSGSDIIGYSITVSSGTNSCTLAPRIVTGLSAVSVTATPTSINLADSNPPSYFGYLNLNGGIIWGCSSTEEDYEADPNGALLPWFGSSYYQPLTYDPALNSSDWQIANGGHQAPSNWSSVGSGSWSNSGNWAYGVPNADGAIAIISVATTAALTVTLNEPVTLGSLVLGSGHPGVRYALTGSGSNTLTFSNTSNSTAATISVIDGTHAVNAPMVLASNLVVTSTSSNPWMLSFGTASNIIDNGNHLSLTMSASNGTLILSGSDDYTGGTIMTAGTLIVMNPADIETGTSLIVGAEAASTFNASVDSETPLTSEAVPEPSTLLLLGVAAIGLLGLKWRKRKQAV